MQTYDPQKVVANIAGIIVTGYASGTFIKAARAEDGYSLTVGADGSAARVRNANRSGTVEFTLLASSPANDLLQALATLDELTGEGVGPLFVKDNTSILTLCEARNAWIKKQADLERAKELSEVTWTVETDELIILVGGTIP